ncbi:MAG: D-Ala-D-Ala carboxypeptidase family metallohydrolase, partial [Hyphomicrobium sp.]
MSDQLRRIIPRVSEARIEAFAEAGRAGDDDRGTEGAEPFDGGYPAELSLSNPEAAETFRSLQNTTEYQAYRAYLDDFAIFLAGKVTLRHFQAHEFLAMGGSHSTPGATCFGKNSLPPRELWESAVKLTTVLDELRERLGAPISLNSVYRCQTYNSCVGGVSG